MARPPEYDSLLKIGSFKEAASDKNSIAQFLRTADDMAVLEHHEVRPGCTTFAIA